MKNLKKLLSSLLIAAAAFSFFSCDMNTEEDESLVVEISVSGTTEKTVTIKAPATYDNKAVHIVYTLDGSEPSVKYDLNATATYNVNYGQANLYTAPFKLSDSAVVKAKGFYVSSESGTPKAYVGPLATENVKITYSGDSTPETANTPDATTDLNFKLATTGNSLFTHYFDNSAEKFTYSFGGTTYKNCYYQFQFTYTGTSKGNWYLYVRQAGTTLPIGYKNSDGSYSTNFLAKGVYEGACFNSSKGTVADGELVLKTVKGNAFDTITISNSADRALFTSKINPDASDTTGNVHQAIEDANAK